MAPFFWRRSPAFTLAELIVVVVILAILATVGLIALSGYVGDASDSRAKTNVRSVYSAITAESAVTGNSPRYYVVHDTGAALSGAVVFIERDAVVLTWGAWNASGTNYSAWNPDWIKLKLDSAKFRVSSSTSRFVEGFFTAHAAYDPSSVLVGAADLAVSLRSGLSRYVGFVQAAWIPSSGTPFVIGNYPVDSTGSVSGLVRDPISDSSTWALVDGALSVGDIQISWEAVVTWDGNSWIPSEPSRLVTKWSAIGVLPTATRVGHTLNGWYTQVVGGTKITTTSTTASDVTYYAQWVPLTYSNVWTPISTVNAPSVRYGHSAVWTGNSLIVWGGANASTYLNTWASYDPATDSWTPISTVNAPMARFLHHSVWTGTRMIVWGWTNYLAWGHLNTWASYDPATDSWTPISTVNAPMWWGMATSVWTGTRMIVWGWMDAGGTAINTWASYDPATDSWTPISTVNAPSARYAHSAVWTGTRMIVWGGGAGTVSWSSYDPATNAWTTIANASSAKTNHSAVWTGTRMIVWGWHNGSTHVNSWSSYDPATNAWTVISAVGTPSARSNHSAVWTGTRMIVWGGGDYDIMSGAWSYPNAWASYDPEANSWIATSTTSAPTWRYHHTATWTWTRMVVWSGTDASGLPFANGWIHN